MSRTETSIWRMCGEFKGSDLGTEFRIAVVEEAGDGEESNEAGRSPQQASTPWIISS